MRLTRLVSKTLRSDPPEGETNSHRLMLKAGLVQQVAAGVYSYLPLAWRSLRKIENIIREEMDAAGGQELMMPALQPMELWEHTGRRAAFGDNLFSLEDRRGRPMVLAPTHEEVVTSIVRANVQSYRDLPVILYQIQTKFRDEPRPRAGLVRVREFDMKDAYSFNAGDESLDESYQAMAQAYRNIYRRCDLPVLMAEADSGAIGGKDSHEFLLRAATGEDTVITCPGCSYTANAEKAVAVYRELTPEPEALLEETATPGIKTIDALAQFLGVPAEKTIKAVFYAADGEVVFVSIRGDLEINEVKLKNVLHAKDLRLADDDEVQAAGLVAGSASAVGLSGIHKIADKSITQGNNFVVGANKPDIHLTGANYPRDFQVDVLDDIALAQPGQLCPYCRGALESCRGIEVGHIFKLGTFFSEAMGALYLDSEGQQRPITMGCYGIGVGRLLAAAIEQNHDQKGIVFPPPVAPYQVHLVALNMSDSSVVEAADRLYQELWARGVETLYDDRPDQAAGVKFNDADLLGLPLRLVVSPRNLKNGMVEVKGRTDAEAEMVTLADIVGAVRKRLKAVQSKELRKVVPRPSFGNVARKRQSDFRNTSRTISVKGRKPSDSKGQQHGHLLALGHETENLYETLRGEDWALRFFRERRIKWWSDTNRSGDTRGADRPTRNMASSQVACVNFLLPLREINGALLAILRAIDADVESVVDIKHKDNVSPVEFEWIGKGGPLERGAAPTRGANTTSVDAFIVAETANGRRAYLLEWKYVEEYRRGIYLGDGRSGETRLRRYSDLYNAESSSFNGRVPITDLLYEPFYQLMRQRLLADRMVQRGELEVSDAKVIAVVPEGNKAYRERITSSPLAERFPNLKTVSDVFRGTLKRPDDAYGMVCPSLLVDAVEQECGNTTVDWVKYQRERYGL